MHGVPCAGSSKSPALRQAKKVAKKSAPTAAGPATTKRRAKSGVRALQYAFLAVAGTFVPWFIVCRVPTNVFTNFCSAGFLCTSHVGLKCRSI